MERGSAASGLIDGDTLGEYYWLLVRSSTCAESDTSTHTRGGVDTVSLALVNLYHKQLLYILHKDSLLITQQT